MGVREAMSSQNMTKVRKLAAIGFENDFVRATPTDAPHPQGYRSGVHVLSSQTIPRDCEILE